MQDLNSPSQSPFSGRILWVVVLTFSMMFLWNKYLEKKYPSLQAQTKNIESQPQPTSAAAPAAPKTVNENTAAASSVDQKNSNLSKEEKLSVYETENVKFNISSKGMSLKGVQLKKYKTLEGELIPLGQSDAVGLFEMRYANQTEPLDFEVSKVSDNNFVGVANVGETTIKRELLINKENNSIVSSITITKPTQELLSGIKILIPEKTTAKQSSSIFFPSYEHQDFLVNQNGKIESTNFSGSKEDINKIYPVSNLISIGSQYFATALLDKSDILPEAHISSKHADKTAIAEVVYKPTNISENIKFSQILFFGPKSMDTLKSVDAEMTHIIDFGIWGFIARPLVYVMKSAHNMVLNWGLAIIILTLLVRLVVLPFNLMSAKSMKAMQKIQPMMNSLKEKYKDDPVKMNQEVMALMKQHKANPLGGCLPMLLQIPVFFALYRVIGSSVDLYQSPFFGWITDLSQHDKFYVLPVLMGITMFVQQKMTPSTMDPSQAKILAFMPLIFTVFMLQLPSGLTLYMFVSALFGITQQWFMLRQKNA